MNEALSTVADDYWEWYLAEHPSEALFYGDHRYVDQVEDLSRQAEDAAIEQLEAFADRAAAIDPASLDVDERITRSVLIHEAGTSAGELRSRMLELAVDPFNGLHVALLQYVGQIPLATGEHAESLITKWIKTNGMFQQAVQRLKQGVARERTPYRSAVEKVIAQIDGYLASPIDSDPFVTVRPPSQFTEEETAVWRSDLADAVSRHVRPGYQAYRDALVGDVIDKARPDERCGISWLADGEEVYARAIRRHTTLDRAPFDIHSTGLEIIGDLGDEYRSLTSSVLGLADVDVIYERLRTDPELRFSSGEEIVAAAQQAMDRASGAVGEWFGRLPVTECVMAEIPAQGAEEAPLGYYSPPADDGSRPGMYFVNTSEPHTRTRFESEALAFHESVPGHHFQIAIAQELEDVHPFRTHSYVTPYVEGWGLYTERLADEMGLYTSDLTRMGMLSFDSWRAGRLVVDTGIHALGWSRQEAIDYLTANSPQAVINIEAEVDRYIGWPGQALAYMTGRLEINRIRAAAEKRLGGDFDIKGFHDVVLGSGPVPLPVLDELVSSWVGGVAGA